MNSKIRRCLRLCGLCILAAFLCLLGAPGCGTDYRTGLWVQLDSSGMAITRLVIQISNPDDPSSQANPVQQERTFADPGTVLDRNAKPENQYWILIYATKDFDKHVRITAKGYLKPSTCPSDHEVGEGTLVVAFEQNVVKEAVDANNQPAAVIFTLPPGTDNDGDGYFTGGDPPDCDDHDSSVNPCADETCGDNLDNNCNGTVDEGCPCTVPSRECWPHWAPDPKGGPCVKGTQTCTSGTWGKCEGEVLPKPEYCFDGSITCDACKDQIDNDCDGYIDGKDPGHRGAALPGEDLGCGGCFVGDPPSPCYEGPDGTLDVGICKGGTKTCLDGSFGPCMGQVLPHGWTKDNPELRQEDDLCNCKDDDCNGTVDDVTVFPPCSKQDGVCNGSQKKCVEAVACDPKNTDGWVDCTDQDYQQHAVDTLCQGSGQSPACCSHQPQDCYINSQYENTTLCDDEDNNCNGKFDDIDPLVCIDPGNPTDTACCHCAERSTKPCPENMDPVIGTCVAGVYNCINGQWVKDNVCVLPSPDLCDDQDNRCIGKIDQSQEASTDCNARNLQAHATIAACVGGVCSWTCNSGWYDGSHGTDNNTVTWTPGNTPVELCWYQCQKDNPAVERCDRKDNDCDGSTDNAPIDTTCPLPGQQARMTVSSCTNGRCDYACIDPFLDCNRDTLGVVPPLGLPTQPDNRDGCEVNSASDPANCGGCHQDNSIYDCGPHTICTNKQCGCAAGYADCNNDLNQPSSDGCETPLGTNSDCLACGNACSGGNDCTGQACDPQNGCYYPAVQNGKECGSRFCNGLEWRKQTCQGGTCSTDALVQNCDDGQSCTSDSCSPSSGCSNTDVSNGTECGTRSCNGLRWNMQTCQTGRCTGSAQVQNCDDSNDCTGDSCSPSTGCSSSSVTNGTECGSRFCNGLEWRRHTCQSGSCSGDALQANCDDGKDCTSDSCSPSSGCSNPNVSNGTECGSRYCNGLIWRKQTCQSGACTGSGQLQNCDDSNVCTNDSCTDATGCGHTNVAGGTDCGSSCGGTGGLVWTPKTCQTGTCTTGSTQNCNDSNVCTSDSCAALSGCTNAAVANGTDCGSSCGGTGGLVWTPKTCQTGTCTTGSTQNCDDSDLCTTDSCAALTGCTNVSMACDPNETCVGGVCKCNGTGSDCTSPFICCSGSDVCHDSQNDAAHCGSCTNDCSSHTTNKICYSGSCGCIDAATDCASGEWCNGSHQCATCNTAQHCGSTCVTCPGTYNKICYNGQFCGCYNNGDCGDGHSSCDTTTTHTCP